MKEAAVPSADRIAVVIARRELVRFARQPARIVAAIGTPVLLWLLMASGLADAIARETLGEVSYSAFLLPGMVTLTAVFAAIFTSISTIDDRREGWLQGALVSPAPAWSIAAGKIAGSAALACAQASILLLALPLLDVPFTMPGVLLALLGVALTSVAMAALGLAFAWRCETTSSFHAVMNLLFMPLWLLSGAFFPADRVAAWMNWLVVLNPMTWATQSIRAPLLGEPWGVPLLITLLFAIVTTGVAVIVVRR